MKRLVRAALATLLGIALAMGGGWAMSHAGSVQVACGPGGCNGGGG